MVKIINYTRPVISVIANFVKKILNKIQEKQNRKRLVPLIYF